MWKYWYHFAIMFEALFILTTIDTGTRIGRFLLQEVLGKVHPRLGLKGGWLGGIIATAIIVAGLELLHHRQQHGGDLAHVRRVEPDAGGDRTSDRVRRISRTPARSNTYG